jgi:hypothetical protein
MKADTTGLINTIAALRQFNHTGVEAFLRAFSAYADRVTEECLDASADTLPAAQARAQQARALLKIFSTQPAPQPPRKG